MSLSWTGITKNKILTDSDINRAVEDGFLTSKITIPTTDKGVTKERALQYININPLYVSYSGKSANQLITKEDIRKGCDECTSYDIVINQSDLNDISGNTDNKIYLYYYPCGTYSGNTSYLSFSYPGTYKNYICAQSCADTEPYLFSSFDGGITLTNSSYVELAGNCALSTYRSISCNGSTVYNVASEGFNYPTTQFDLGQTFGNIDVTITITGNTNTNNEIFIGNKAEGYGTTYIFGTGAQSISDTIGYISSTNKTILDIIVYSTTTGGTFTPYNITFTTSCPTSISCSTNSISTTYVSGTTINVTRTGYIKYDNISGTQYVNLPSLGQFIIVDCILVDTLASGIPLANTATFNSVVTGTTCSQNSGIPNCVTMTFIANQGYSATAYWLNCSGIQQTRFITAGETFTTCGLQGSGTGIPVYSGSAC
jgi:hypothetical protein